MFKTQTNRKSRKTSALIALMAAIMLCGLVACDGVSLVDYKVEEKALIDAHIETKTQVDYSAENWTLKKQILATFKICI